MSKRKPRAAPTPPVYCSFCGDHQDLVALMIAGPKGVAICGECLELCVETANEHVDAIRASRSLMEAGY